MIETLDVSVGGTKGQKASSEGRYFGEILSTARTELMRLQQMIADGNGEGEVDRDTLRSAFAELEALLVAPTDFGKRSDAATAADDFELHTVLRSAVAGQVFVAKERGIKLSCLVHKDVPRRAHGDGPGLKLALVTFVENVVRYACDAEVVVRIVADCDTRGAITLRISTVTPDGVLARKMQAGGASRGMHLFQELVRGLGGVVGVAPGGEAWFTVSISSARNVDPAARLEPQVPHFPILLVSNDPDQIPAIMVLLQRHGFEVELEKDKRRFASRLRQRDYSLVLMDSETSPHVATLASRPHRGRMRKVAVLGVPRNDASTIDEPALLRRVERCLRGERV